MCLQVLEAFDSSGNAQGGYILLISDGMENIHPLMDTVKPEIIRKGVTVHSILYSSDADPQMEQLSIDSGGKSFFDSGLGDSIDLLEDLISITEIITYSQMPGDKTAPSPKVQVGKKRLPICKVIFHMLSCHKNIHVFLLKNLIEEVCFLGFLSYSLNVQSQTIIHGLADLRFETIKR